MGPTAFKVIVFDVSSQYWSQMSRIRCVGPTFSASGTSYNSQKRYSVIMKYGPQNGTNSIQGYCIRCFQLVLVPTILNQVCWSHFFGLWNKLQLLEAVQFNYEIWSTKSDQQHPRSFFSMFLVSIGPKCLESGMWDQQVPTDANRYQQVKLEHM